MEILEKAAASPFLDRQGPRKLLTGIILSFVPVISFFSMGYLLRVFQARLENEASWEMPEWQDRTRLFFQGLILFLTILTYTIVPFLTTSISLAMIGSGFWLVMPSLLFMVISAALWLLAIFMLPMALAHFLHSGEILSILNARMIFHSIGLVLSRYFRTTVITLMGLLVVSIPVKLSPYGYLVSAPFSFLLGVFLASAYGEICRPAVSPDQGR